MPVLPVLPVLPVESVDSYLTQSAIWIPGRVGSWLLRLEEMLSEYWAELQSCRAAPEKMDENGAETL